MPSEAFEVGERASRERDGEKRICGIIERKQLPDGQWTYYVHYEGLNRRLDSWVSAEELQPIEAQAPNETRGRPTRQDAVNSRRATRNMKRKIDEINASSLNDTEHDEAMEKCAAPRRRNARPTSLLSPPPPCAVQGARGEHQGQEHSDR